MSNNNLFVISGPEEKNSVAKESIGKHFFKCLKQKNPDRPLIINGVTGEITTTGAFLENSIKLATFLESLGLKKGDAISIISQNSANFPLPVVAAFYVGVVVNNLNPSYSVGELRHAFNLVKPKLVIGSESAVNNVLKVREEFDFLQHVMLLGPKSKQYPDLKSIEDILETITVNVDEYQPNDFDPSETDAMILLSSGTTGLPKGVLMTHENLRSPLSYIMHPDYGAVTSDDVNVAVLPFFHIFGALILLTSLSCGMKSIILEKFKPEIFLQTIQDYKVTKLFVVPPLLLFLANTPLIEKYDVSSINDIMCGGAPVGKEAEESAKKKFRSVKIRQIYGLTETSGGCTFLPPDSDKIGSAGVLVPGMCAKVVDLETKKPVDAYETGELCFKGSMIMKSYVHNEKETAESIDEDGFYHSGDIGYYDEDGFFYIIDRLKELIKYKGFQVPPAELEDLIISHPAVKDCGVIGISDEKAGQVPLAFVVRQNNANVVEEDIVNFVAENISVQKRLYGGVKFIDEIPRNPSGKILRRSLKEIV